MSLVSVVTHHATAITHQVLTLPYTPHAISTLDRPGLHEGERDELGADDTALNRPCSTDKAPAFLVTVLVTVVNIPPSPMSA